MSPIESAHQNIQNWVVGPAAAVETGSRMRSLMLILTVLLASLAGSATAQAADTTPPVITITTPPEGAVYHQFDTVTSSFTCTDADSGIDTGPFGCSFALPFGGGGVVFVGSGAPIDTSTPGARTFTVNATDVAGNPASETRNYTVLPDETPPTVTFTTPADGTTINQGDAVNLDFSCADDGPFASGLAPDSPFDPFNPHPGCSAFVNTPFGFGSVLSGSALNTANLGTYTATVSSRDRAGNLTTVTHTFTIVIGPPKIFITSPADGDRFTKDQVVLASYVCPEGIFGQAPVCSGPVAKGAAIDTSTVGTHDFTVNATGSTGLTASKTAHYTVVGPGEDATDPTVSLTVPAANAALQQDSVVNASYSCADEAGGSGIDQCAGATTNVTVPGSPTLPLANGSPIDTSVTGYFRLDITAIDRAGNSTTSTTLYQVAPPGADTTKPTVTILSPSEGASYQQNQVVNADFACADQAGGSGVATCSGDAPNGDPINTSTVGPHTFTVTAIDQAGNVTTLVRNYTVAAPPDTTKPTVTLGTPAEGASYTKNQVVNASYTCADDVGGSGIATCVGTVASGSAIDTATVGAKTFTVTATDHAGNTASVTHSYTVVAPAAVSTTLTAASTSSPNYVLKATLKAGTTPVAGQTVTFKAGNVALCTAVTNAQGVAQCSPGSENKTKIAAINNNGGYTATFAATGQYLGATANGTLSGGGGKG